ncbi:divalent-cation tolerance protein CutA [Deinococcus pimensis]|uniref:divalent-cation tolerance protein CutA n=1 Tax=Deinococcus pimensis TaxID=309888 RepID=UPI000484A9AE|nr:divalent-cation tolerance protein CutA [Deinococcus pimensis]
MPLVILVTLPPDRATDLARVLVEERLAACVNIVPQMTTVYRWQGDVVVDAEALLVIKTEEDQYDALERRVTELHPYDVPEIIALPTTRTLPSYLSWLQDSVR